MLLTWILVSEPIWLFLTLILMILLYRILLRLLTFLKNKNDGFGMVIKGLCVFIFIFFVSIGLRILVFDIYKIPSSSMEDTLMPDDVIVVNKLKYGPKLPRSPFEIPFVNIAFYLNKKTRKSINDVWWDYVRLSGTAKVKNGDVMVFDMFAGMHKMIIVKRCMAIAGDRLEIKEGNVFVNNEFFNPSELINNNYQFRLRDRAQFFKVSDSLGINIHLNGINKNRCEATLSIKEKNELENMALIDSVRMAIDTLSAKYPESKQFKWTLDNYGPILIPKKGMTIKMTQLNFDIYDKIINDHEDSQVEVKEGRYYLDGKEIMEYTFKHNYYFMMGDNRKGSMDSRFWGLVPENRIIGKVQCVFFSNFRERFQWKRLFKKVI